MSCPMFCGDDLCQVDCLLGAGATEWPEGNGQCPLGHADHIIGEIECDRCGEYFEACTSCFAHGVRYACLECGHVNDTHERLEPEVDE